MTSAARTQATSVDLQALHSGVWRAHTLADATQAVHATGEALLDTHLPGGGWPVGAPLPPLVPALHTQGLAVQRVQAPDAAQCIWSADHALRCAEIDVLLWMGSEQRAHGTRAGTRYDALRLNQRQRLQMAAVEHQTLLFAFGVSQPLTANRHKRRL
ncbi:hypothetical protein [Rhodoferax sp.]|uniref:hypothetical protein n=1 Tax=Rhodoferax sp. TaxID=50421 RepID=UPI0025CE3BFA|nr:hypothetical protein [Rhodoferax sp.]